MGHTDKTTRIGTAGLLLVTLLLAAASPAVAQERRTPSWTVSLEGGTQLRTTVYDEWVRLSLPRRDDIPPIEVQTRWTELFGPVPVFRLTSWYRPDAPFHFYATLQHMTGPTTSIYHGGITPPDTIDRALRALMFEGGVGIRLFRWAAGRGGLGYTVGPVWTRHVLDTSAGHRDAFLRVDPEASAATDPNWSDRSWTGWGFSIGTSIRQPIGDRLTLRIGAQNHILPRQGDGVGQQERSDIQAFSSGRTPGVNVTPYAAAYFSVRVGVEYTLGWLRTPWEGLFEAPIALDPPPPPTPEVAQAMRDAAGGDTATAVSELREQLAADPADASAWRELGLLLAGMAGDRPQLRPEAWEALRRGLTAYPDDHEILAALGRVRGLMSRTAQTPEAPPASLHVSEVSAAVDAAGELTLAIGVRSGARDATAYDLVVQVFGPGGRPVPLRRAGAAPDQATERVELSAVAPQDDILRLRLRLARAEPGPHTVRLRVLDPQSGLRAEATGAFEVR